MKYAHYFSLFLAALLLCVSSIEPQTVVDVKAKQRAMQRLLKRGVAFLKKNSVGLSCHKFTHDPAWREGDLFLFLLDVDGTCYTFGDERSRIWNNFAHLKDAVGTPLISRFLEAKPTRAISVMLNNSAMHVYVRRLNKRGKTFLMGCGFYPQSPEYMVIDLVYLATQVLRELGLSNGFSEINNPYGHLVRGDSYVFVIGQDGVIHAQGSESAQVGKNILAPPVESPNEQSTRDLIIYRRALASFLQSNEREGWLPPVPFNNATRRIFATKYKDPTTNKKYVVGSFYYPDVTDDSIYSLVQKAITYLKALGKDAAFAQFNDPHGPLALGQGRIVVYGVDGTCLANAENADFIGYNLIDRADAQGHFTVRRLIQEVALYGHAWVNEFSRNSYRLIYAERVDLPSGPLIITAAFWPDSEELAARSMINRAVNYVALHGKGPSLEKFTGFDSDVLRGNMHLTVLDTQGILLGDGPYRKHAIWSDMDLRDRFGRRIVEQIITTASRGGGWVSYKKNNGDFRAYTQMARAPDIQNVIDSNMVIVTGYYL